MAHPGDKGRCLLDGYIECAAITDQACICEKMPADVAQAYYRRKFGDHNDSDDITQQIKQEG